MSKVQYYTLADIPGFDQNGLWRYKGIFFSRYGNLKKTLKVLIDNSSAGLTVAEAGKIMGLSLNSFMAQPGNIQQLRREKINGIFVYFSSDEGSLFKQRKNREESIDQVKLMNLPTDAEGIIILVERIKNPQLSIEQLSVKLTQKGQKITAEVIQNFFGHHGLLKKT